MRIVLTACCFFLWAELINASNSISETAIGVPDTQSAPLDSFLTANMAADSTSQSKSVQLYVEIVSTSRVLVEVDPRAPILGIAHNGERFKLAYQGKSWYRIAFKDSVGWIEKTSGRIVDSPNQSSAETQAVSSMVLLGLLLLLALAIIGGILMVALKSRQLRKMRVTIGKNVLILAASEKQITYSLTNRQAPLVHCFTEMGFHVQHALTIASARKILSYYAPDVMLIDWTMLREIQPVVETLLHRRTSLLNGIVIFYNVPDPRRIVRSESIPNVAYLGKTISDRDLFALVTPLVITGTSHKNIQNSVQHFSLEGELSADNLSEVLQFLEIGKKTGCLSVSGPSFSARIFIELGRIVHAHNGPAKGMAAIQSVLAEKRGKFNFELNASAPQKDIAISPLQVLLEWAKDQDETHRR